MGHLGLQWNHGGGARKRSAKGYEPSKGTYTKEKESNEYNID